VKIVLKFIILFSLLSQLIVSDASAQQISQDSELDKKYTPNENSIFNNLRKKNSNSTFSSEVCDFENAVYFTPSMLLRKKVYFCYERKMSDFFMFGAGLGKAFDSDFLQELGGFFSSTNDFYSNDVLNAYDIYKNSTYTSSSPLLQLDIRYYPEKVFEEAFAELSYRFETMRYMLNDAIVLTPASSSREVIFTMQSLTIGYGYAWLAGKNKKMVNKFFMNAGVKYIKYPRFDNTNQRTYNYLGDVYERNETEFKTNIFLTINIGYSFGFGF
jgi:hypothetical protein